MGRRRGSIRWLLASLILALALPLVGATAAAPPAQESSLDLFLVLFPELRALPAPAWVQPGLRATYYDSSASIAQVPDEDGSGGSGLSQYDVVARDRRRIPLAAKLYLDLGDGRFQSNLSFGQVSAAGAGEFWLNPLAFRRAAELDIPDLSVNLVDYEVAGETFDAIRFDSVTDESNSAWVFDVRTGLLLFSRSLVEGATHDQQSTRTLVGTRTLDLPWAAGRAPRALRAGETLVFEGVSQAIISGGDPINLPVQSTLEVEATHTRWNEWNTQLTLNGLPQLPTAAITGGLQLFNAFWLPPDALEANVRRPLIDSDPYTGASVSYQRDGDFTILTETGGGFETIMVYDADGLLAAFRSTLEVGIALQVYDLQRVR